MTCKALYVRYLLASLSVNFGESLITYKFPVSKKINRTAKLDPMADMYFKRIEDSDFIISSGKT